MNARVYNEVESRAAGHCEQCGHSFGVGLKDRATLDHFEGRARSETIETCWLLCWNCHSAKGLNDPSAAYWMVRFCIHAKKHGYLETLERTLKRLEFKVVQHGVNP
jgi:hypothetical protein